MNSGLDKECFVGHKKEDGTKQLLKEHLKGTAERAAVFEVLLFRESL